MSHFEDTLARILATAGKVETQYKRSQSHFALFKEYMRRTAIWGQEFGWEPSYGALLRTDQAGIIQPDISLPENITAQFEGLHLSSWEKRFYLYALKWAVLEDRDESGRFALLNPYEPLLLLYERGGYITSEHGYIDITSSIGIPMASRTTSSILNYPPLDMTEAALDTIDEERNVKPNSTTNG